MGGGMITMHNVVKRGRTVWDRSLLPDDEYGERVRLVREAMAREGIDALVGIGHTASYGSLTYLTRQRAAARLDGGRRRARGGSVPGDGRRLA